MVPVADKQRENCFTWQRHVTRKGSHACDMNSAEYIDGQICWKGKPKEKSGWTMSKTTCVRKILKWQRYLIEKMEQNDIILR